MLQHSGIIQHINNWNPFSASIRKAGSALAEAWELKHQLDGSWEEVGEGKGKERNEWVKEASRTGEISRVTSTSSQHQSPLLILNFPQTLHMFLNCRKSSNQESNSIYPKNDVHFQDAPKNEHKTTLMDWIPGEKKNCLYFSFGILNCSLPG